MSKNTSIPLGDLSRDSSTRKSRRAVVAPRARLCRRVAAARGPQASCDGIAGRLGEGEEPGAAITFDKAFSQRMRARHVR